MGLQLETHSEDLNVEIRRESVYLSDGFSPYDDLSRTQHIFLYQSIGNETTGVVEVSKEWLAKLLDFWTPEKRAEHGI